MLSGEKQPEGLGGGRQEELHRELREQTHGHKILGVGVCVCVCVGGAGGGAR